MPQSDAWQHKGHFPAEFGDAQIQLLAHGQQIDHAIVITLTMVRAVSGSLFVHCSDT